MSIKRFCSWAKRQLHQRGKTVKQRPIRNQFRPALNSLEQRAVPAVMVATDVAPGGQPLVQIIDPTTKQVQLEIMAFDPSFTGGVDVATTGDDNGDNYPDVIICGAGPGGGPHIRTFDGKTGAPIENFFAYENSFRGGVNVAMGDINRDGEDDILAGTGVGGGPRVQVIDGVSGDDISSFFAYDDSFRGGISVASGDVDQDGFDDIVCGAGPGGGPHVAIFNGEDFSSLGGFFAYESTFDGGLTVDIGDTNGDGSIEIVTGPQSGGGSVIKIFTPTGDDISAFLAFEDDYRGGIRIKVENIDDDDKFEIVVLREDGGANTIRIRFLDDDGTFDDLDDSSSDDDGTDDQGGDNDDDSTDDDNDGSDDDGTPDQGGNNDDDSNDDNGSSDDDGTPDQGGDNDDDSTDDGSSDDDGTPDQGGDNDDDDSTDDDSTDDNDDDNS